MTVATAPMPASSSEDAAQQRLGKSLFWLEFQREEHGMNSSWRCIVQRRPARTGKNSFPLPVLEITPRRPLFTVVLGGESYPLLIDQWSWRRGGRLLLQGRRKAGAKRTQNLTWLAEIRTRIDDGSVRLDVSARLRCSPPEHGVSDARIQVSCPLFQPVIQTSASALERGATAAGVWSRHASMGASFAADFGARESAWEPGTFVAEAQAVDLRGRTPVRFSLQLACAKTEQEAQRAFVAHLAKGLEPAYPRQAEWPLTLLEIARRSAAYLAEPARYETVGMERIYFRAKNQPRDPAEMRRYCPGFPDFSIYTSAALLAWGKFYQDEQAARIAGRAARGIAADFAVIPGGPGVAANKGAFWDCAAGHSGGPLAFSGIDGKVEHSLLTNARIAFVLFRLFIYTRDPLFRQIGLNACHWLILRQDERGYYPGETVDGTTGRTLAGDHLPAGVEVIRALVGAFRVTANSVFIMSAWKIADFILSDLLARPSVTCLFPGPARGQSDCPVTLASIIQALSDLDGEAENQDLRAALRFAGARLAACSLSDLSHPCLNYDGSYGGVYECASAAFRMMALDHDPFWLRLGYTLLRAVPEEARMTWRSLPASLNSLIVLGALLPESQISLEECTVVIGRATYQPDASAQQYLTVTRGAGGVDVLPLVCRDTDQTLVLVLSFTDGGPVTVRKSNRAGLERLVMRDLVSRELVTNPVMLTPFSYGACGGYAILQIDP